MIMTEEMRKFSVFYVSFPNNFLNYFPNILCSSTNYLRFVLDYINKMDWDYCLFSASSKEKTDKEKKRKQTKARRKLKKLTRKLYHSSINLQNKICFRWKNSLVIIMKRQYSTYSKWTMQSTIKIASPTISRNWRDLWKKEREIMIRRKKLKRISDLKKQYQRDTTDRSGRV